MSNFGILVTVCFLVFTSGEESKTKTGTGTEEVSSKIMYPNDFLLDYQRHHHHHHAGGPVSPRTQMISPNNGRQILNTHVSEEAEPDPVDVDYSENDYGDTNEIPLDFIQEMNKYNVSDLLLNFVEGGDVEYDDPFIKSRFGGNNEYEARSAAVTPKPAACTPEVQTISLATSDDPSVLYIPKCTKVERCGGCCSHTLLSCQPKETETITYQVIKTQYTGAKKLKFLGKEIVPVEKHIKCKCDCKVKEEHCNKYQEYRPSECRCACSNTDDEKKCDKSGTKKLWNSELCACQCRNIVQCSTGYYFDQLECRCTPNPKRRYASYDRPGYVSESQLTVTPLSIDN